MNMIRSSFNFLSGITFAIGLITFTACLMIMGTFLESYTQSHQFASKWIYSNPLLRILLLLFFINILFSALKRWPFKQRHLPFLLTHLGLLMIIGGTAIKNFWGIQGNLSVWEGSGNQTLIIPNTFAIGIEKNEGFNHKSSFEFFPVDPLETSQSSSEQFSDLNFKLIGYTPHAKQKYETWFKGEHVFIKGMGSLKIHHWEKGNSFPAGVLLPLRTNDPQEWQIIALNSSNPQDLLPAIYSQHLSLKITFKNDSKIIFDQSLEQALDHPIHFSDGKLTIRLQFADDNNIHPYSYLEILFENKQNNLKESFQLPLQGENALFLQSQSKWKGAPFIIDLYREHPLLCFIESENQRIVTCDQHGRFHQEIFNSEQPQSLYSLDRGFGGYSIQATLPFPSIPSGRKEKEQARRQALTKELKEAFQKQPLLSPPLEILKEAVRKSKKDLHEIFIEFLYEWNKTNFFLFESSTSFSDSLADVLKNIDWHSASRNDFTASYWLVQVFQQLEESYHLGIDYLESLKKSRWPFSNNLEEKLKQIQIKSAPNLIAGQLLSIAEHFPSLENSSRNVSISQSALLLSALFRAYDIDFHSIHPIANEVKDENFNQLLAFFKKDSDSTIILETPLTITIIPEDPPIKLEECCPGILLEMTYKNKKEKIALAYDPTLSGLKRPIFQGAFSLRFQPQVHPLPYRIRLHEARQIFYPNTEQVYSYESDISISGKDQTPSFHTLSMNEVYETWDGYRFYLAGMGTASEHGIKRIQLIVNRDPAKYILTYPGALFVFIGIILLFWLRPYKSTRL